MKIIKTKPKNFYKEEFYVEYDNGGDFNNIFTNKRTLNKLKKLQWITIKLTRQLKYDNRINDYFYREI